MSETRKYGQFTPDQKAEIVLAGLRGDRPVRDVCWEYEIAETLYYHWRQRLLEGGKAALANPREKTAEHTEIAELRRKVGQLERALGRMTYELEIAAHRLDEAGVPTPTGTARWTTRRICRLLETQGGQQALNEALAAGVAGVDPG